MIRSITGEVSRALTYAGSSPAGRLGSEAALENGVSEYARVPPGGGLEDVTSVFRARIYELGAW
ncbi:hypothetical protein ABZ023_30470 [Streptomyces sp. NPDC006367]|uniref:hypothetical protein n=1 Tax=unclassified Streptomyces TaxID=2593676 RepID=UPI0033B97AC4